MISKHCFKIRFSLIMIKLNNEENLITPLDRMSHMYKHTKLISYRLSNILTLLTMLKVPLSFLF